jgi:Family of unknown function (DUF6343)/Protein of unknown function (DUF3099)
MRSGDEPGHARSPLRARLGLAGFGLVAALIAAFVVRNVAPVGVDVLFLAIAVVAAVDLLVVARHLRLGPHFQPGTRVPPYRPVEPEPQPRRPEVPVSERTRMRRYLVIMIVCLTLIALAWFWVRFYSTTIAVVMSGIAAVLPPIAVIIANFGVRLPDEPVQPPRPRPSGAREGDDADHPDPPG